MAQSEFRLEFEYRNQRYLDAARGLAAFGQKFEGNMQRLPPVLRRELLAYLQSVAKALAEKHSGPYPGGTSENTLSKRSGTAVAGILASPRVTGTQLSDIVGYIGGPHYLKIQETGGTITAKNAKYLTIPLPAALYPNGVPRMKSARDWNNTFVATSKKGNLIIFQRRGKEIMPLYVLKKSVKIPARLGMRAALVGGLDYFVDRAVDAMLKEMMQ